MSLEHVSKLISHQQWVAGGRGGGRPGLGVGDQQIDEPGEVGRQRAEQSCLFPQDVKAPHSHQRSIRCGRTSLGRRR